MTLVEFVEQLPSFDGFAVRDRIRLFGWYLHVHKDVGVLTSDQIRDCFRQLHANPPDVLKYMKRMADAKPPELIGVRGGYILEGSVRRALDAKYGAHQSIVSVSKLLADLPAQVPNLAERTFLSEALSCYRAKAYRAAIVMTWNLAFDHLLNWIVTDPKRLAAFNSGISIKYPKRIGLSVTQRSDFDELKEAETIEICRTADLLPKNKVEILREKLKRRNIAAHPSEVVISQHQADDSVTDLVNNIVLALT